MLLAAPIATASAAVADDVSAQATANTANSLRKAWKDPNTTLITLTASIDLGAGNNDAGAPVCSEGEPLRQSANSNAIIIDGQGKYGLTQTCPDQRVLRDDVEGETVTLQGLTHFTGGNALGHGGGLRNNGPVDVVSSDVSGNHAYADNTCHLSNADVQAQDCGEDGDGGGIYAGVPDQAGVSAAASGFDVTVTDSTISDNEAADDGGGVYAQDSLNVTNSTFSDNIAHGENFGGGRGGGGFAGNGVTTLDSTFAGNTARCDTSGGKSILCDAVASGGGFFTDGPADVTGTTFSDNTAGDGCAACGALGGGFFSNDGATVAGSTFDGNSATCTVDFTSERNTCGADGGGFASNQADVSGSTFTDNVAECTFSGYEEFRYCDGSGGAISTFRVGLLPPFPAAATEVLGNLTLDESTLSGNTATYDGGAIWTDAHSVDVVASTFDHNTAQADTGGAITSWPWWNNAWEGSTFSMTNSTVTANRQPYLVTGRSVRVFADLSLFEAAGRRGRAGARGFAGVQVNRTLGEIRLQGGGAIDAWSLDFTGRAARGRKYHSCLVDEAAHDGGYLKDTLEAAIAPATLDFKGKIVLARARPTGLKARFGRRRTNPSAG